MISEKKFLEGPKNRLAEWRFAIRAGFELIRAVNAFRIVGPCVTFFGSARISRDDPYYELARSSAFALGEQGFTIMTGGGPGIMEAANKGAREAGATSLACNIILPHEQGENPYLDAHFTTKFFFIRKVILVKYSYGFVILPGGIGTMDELFEILTLIRTGKSAEVPVVLMGTQHWQPLLSCLDEMIKKGYASHHDRDLIFVTDSVDAMANHIREGSKHKLLRRRKLMVPAVK